MNVSLVNLLCLSGLWAGTGLSPHKPTSIQPIKTRGLYESADIALGVIDATITTHHSLTHQLAQEYQDTAAQARHKPHESKRLCANVNEILYSNLISEIRLKLASPQAKIPTIERDLLRLMQQFAHEQGHSMRMRSVEQQYERQLERQNDDAPCAFLMPAWSLLAAPSHDLRPRDMHRLPESTRQQIATLKNLIGKIGVLKSAKPNLRQNMIESMLTYRPQPPPVPLNALINLSCAKVLLVYLLQRTINKRCMDISLAMRWALIRY